MRFLPLIAASMCIGSAFVAAPVYAEDALGSVSGKIHLTAKSADVGVGYTWGSGKLIYKGKTYRFSVSGGQVAAVGFSKFEGNGTVYNLHNLKDFSGTFVSATGEATLGAGVGGTVMENRNGVRIKFTSSSQGARLAAGGEGITLTLKK